MEEEKKSGSKGTKENNSPNIPKASSKKKPVVKSRPSIVPRETKASKLLKRKNTQKEQNNSFVKSK